MKKHLLMAVASVAAMTIASCVTRHTDSPAMMAGIDPAKFVAEVDGKPTALYCIKSSTGMEVAITNYGGRIVALEVPGRDGKMRDVVLGFDSIQAYLPENNQTDFGAAIGRYANRIDHGRLPIDGDTIQLPVNNFGHTLHGGPTGWQYQVYATHQPNDSTLILTMDSPDGDNGFPGNVKATVTYTALPGNKLDIAYSATTDKPTVVNLTNHSYFNLSGDATVPVTNHMLYVYASGFTPVDSTYMTTSEILPVVGTPMDFTVPKRLGADIDKYDYEQLKNGNGYDHNWVLDTEGCLDKIAATIYSPESGVGMSIYTDEPGIQVYSGNFLDGTVTGKGGVVYNQRTGIALETQHYPDSPNKADWPSVMLRPGETYTSHTILSFFAQ
ncbi:MAG: galactose mutarotase [Duncaniella sp.]|nr:galactose mutarotase [Duncaniella sp.]